MNVAPSIETLLCEAVTAGRPQEWTWYSVGEALHIEGEGQGQAQLGWP